MDEKPLLNEIATTLDGRDITRGWINPLLLQQPDDPVLIARGAGNYVLYREVLRDDRVKAALQQRINAVTSRPWRVEAGGDKRVDKQAADYLEEQLDALRWDAITEKMLAGVFYGYAVAEVMWRVDGARIGIADIKVRDRRRFGFDGAGRLRLMTAQNMNGELLPERKFWHFCTGADHDDAPYGLGLAHWLYWPVWFKRNGIKFWAVFLEKFGSPTAVGKYPGGTNPEDQAKLLAALEAIQTDSAIVFPDGMVAELLEASRGGTADYQGFEKSMNDAILTITIGQTATTSGTPGKLGGEQAQSDVRADISKADADLVCMSFNYSVARWLTEYNFPGAAVPRVWRDMEPEEDLSSRAERDERVTKMGYKPSLQYIMDTYGGEWEATAPPAPVTPFGQQAGPLPGGDPATFAEAGAEADYPDQIALDAALAGLGGGALTAQAGQAILPLLAWLRKASDPADALGRLAEVYPSMDTDALETLLTRLLFAAQVWGALSAEEESAADA